MYTFEKEIIPRNTLTYNSLAPIFQNLSFYGFLFAYFFFLIFFFYLQLKQEQLQHINIHIYIIRVGGIHVHTLFWRKIIVGLFILVSWYSFEFEWTGACALAREKIKL